MNKPTAPTPPQTLPVAGGSRSCELTVFTTPRIMGNCMSLSDAEIIYEALEAHRDKTVEGLEWLLGQVAEAVTTAPDEAVKLLQRDCIDTLEVIKCCNSYLSDFASDSLGELRMRDTEEPPTPA